MADGSVERVTLTLTNCPGQRGRFSFANVPLILIVPVVWSTALSTNVIRPFGAGPTSVGGWAVTRTVPAARYRLNAGSCASGIANDTKIGAIWLITTSGVVSLARTRLPA